MAPARPPPPRLACWLLAVFAAAAAAASVVVAAQEATQAAAGPEDAAQEGNTLYWVYVHAIVMSLAWVGLLPHCLHAAVGILLGQSRWAGPLRQPVAGKKWWFWLHLAVNVTGVALVIAGFAIAVSESCGMQIEKGDGSVAYTHKVLGIIAFVLLLMQAVAAFIRPHPHSALRGAWNAVHHNLGRLLILLAWATIWLGVAVGVGEVLPGSRARWVAPVAVAQGLILFAYLLNQGLKKRTFREETKQKSWEKKHTERNGSGGVAGVVRPAGAPAGPAAATAATAAAAAATGNGPGRLNGVPGASGGHNVYGSSIRPAVTRVESV